MGKQTHFEYAISACLVGVPCRWNGQAKLNKKALSIFLQGKSLLICPEVSAGLSTPRPACEIQYGNGEDVLSGRAKVISKNGKNHTKYFIKGAKVVCQNIRALGIQKAILKTGSPSCGVTKIYSGKFDGKKKEGTGVTAALFLQNKILVREF